MLKLTIALTMLISTVNAQPVLEPHLQLGDKVPNIAFTDVTGKKFNLYDITAEMIVLDFWASWCGSCIAEWPAADSLQYLYGNRIAVILVNTQMAERPYVDTASRRILKSKAKLISNLYFFAMRDTTAFNLFKHQVIPHYVWLRREIHEKEPAYYPVAYLSGGLRFSDMLRHAYRERDYYIIK